MSLIDPHVDAGDVYDREEISPGLLVATGDCSKAFDVMEEALDLATQTIEGTILSASVVFACRVHRNDRLHASRSGCADNAVCVVTGVGDQRLASRVFDERLRLGGIVMLTWGQNDVERFAFGRRDRVDFGRKTSSRTAQTIALDPPFPPAASWCARTTEPSMIEPTSSTSIRSCLKTRSQVPRLAQRSKRLYTVFQLPYLSGMSRQGAPVFSRHITALTKSRSPRLARGPRLVGIRGSICCHCSSLSSCRCTASVDQLFDRRATMISGPLPRPDFRLRAFSVDQEIRDTP